MIAQTNHQLTKVQQKLNWRDDLFMNGENLHDKNPTGWFWGHHSQESNIIKTSSYK